MDQSPEAIARRAVMYTQAGDSQSAFYQGMMALIRSCEANDKRARLMAKSITIPFSIPEAEVVQLEEQFGVSIRQRGVHNRACLTPRVSAMVHCLDSQLLELAGGGERKVLVVDGDLATLAAVGVEDRIVERSYASPRLAFGYYAEDEAIRRICGTKDGNMLASASLLAQEVTAGGGEHFWPSVREAGALVDTVVINHFKTPCGPGQAAWLALARGATVVGCFPFQLDMMHAETGDLACFPGRFYVDRVNDIVTLVPSSDATMSISHPFSSLIELLQMNSVCVGGVEFLCEKFLTVRGVLFYTLRRVGEDFKASEVLRTSLYDSAAARTTVVTYPKAKLSAEGVLVGWERGEVRMLTSRFERVMARCRTSESKIVHPSEVLVGFVDYNNVVVNTLDTAVTAERMSVGDEDEASIALALLINYRRHEMKGTFNVLLDAVRKRAAMDSKSLMGFAMVALSAWWSGPRVVGDCQVGELPVQSILDWCGNDFSVTAGPMSVWLDFEQEAGLGKEYVGRFYPHLPRPKFQVGDSWYNAILKAAADVAGIASAALVPGLRSGAAALRAGPVVGAAGICPPLVDEKVVATVVGMFSNPTYDPAMQLTPVKQRLVKKLAKDQAAACEPRAVREVVLFDGSCGSDIPSVPVPDVDPVSAVGTDLAEMMGGLPERDAATTGYRIAEVDIVTNIDGNLTVNDLRRDIPKRRQIRRPVVDAGVEGARVASQAALFGALKKRNVGIPPNRGNVDLSQFPDAVVQRFIDVCFVEGWEEILARHLNAGLWEFNEPDIEQYMDSLDETKARRLLESFFMEGEVDLSRWLLMAKGKIKPSREEGAEYKVDHSQTIMYLEDGSVNAAYSAMTKRFKKVLDEMLRPNIQINSQMNVPDHEEWYNSINADRDSRVSTTSYSIDARSYDRSQDHVGLKAELRFYARMGLNEERLRIWSETHGPKKAVSLMFRVVLNMVLGGVSGLWKTLLRNGLIMAFAVIYSTSVTRKSLVMLDVKGDDVDMEVDGPLPVEASADMMCMAFNLSAKFFTSDVRYFCKMFRIRKWGRWFFLADPWARIQTICTPVVVGNSVDTLAERWESVKPDLLHYDNGVLVDEAALAAQQYYGLPLAPYGIARSLAKFAVDRNAYFGFFKSPEWVS